MSDAPIQTPRLYPGTVTVMPTSHGFRWRCSCGAHGGDRDERACRDEGYAHQRTHDPNAGQTANTPEVADDLTTR